MLHLKVKRVDVNATVPKYHSEFASGLDLHACLRDPAHKLIIRSGARLLVPTGLSVEIPLGYEAQIRPRSGLAHKQGVFACLGTIDQDYRGEISVNLFNCSFETAHIEHGDRIAQLVIAPVARVNIVETEELSETLRGASGFGSSGTK
jgi:dUTP pyrophosphatase